MTPHQLIFHKEGIRIISKTATASKEEHYILQSNSIEMKIAEVKSFIKDVTASSFLHAKDFTCYFDVNQYTLIPSSVYDAALIDQYFELNFGKIQNECTLTAQSLLHIGITSIHEIPTWAAQFCQNIFPEQALNPLHIQYLKQVESFQNDAIGGALCIGDQRFNLQLFQHGKLLFSQEISYQNEDDIVYYTLGAFKKLPIDTAKGNISVYPVVQGIDPTRVIETINKIIDLNDYSFVIQSFDNYQNDLLCV